MRADSRLPKRLMPRDPREHLDPGASLPQKVRGRGAGGAMAGETGLRDHPIPNMHPGGLDSTSSDSVGVAEPFWTCQPLPCPLPWRGGELTAGCTGRYRVETGSPVSGTSSCSLPSAEMWIYSKVGAVTGHTVSSLSCLLSIRD